MAYDSTRPADDETLSVFPAGNRENLRALKEDGIANAGTLKGMSPNNNLGQIPISNGNVNTNLNADMVDGKHASAFATASHVHSDATSGADGFMSMADKVKLDGIATGAEVNQNAWSNVTVGSTTIQADAKQDTLTLVAGANMSITPDATNDKITFGLTGTVPASAACTGNAATANKWATARTVSLTGGATGSASIDGSADVSLNVTALDASKLSGTAAVSTTGNAATATKSTGDKNGVDITNYLRGDVSITPSQSQTVAASGTPATLFAILLSKIKAMQGTTNFQDAVPATLSALSGYFDSSGNALTAVKGKSTPTAGDNSLLIATTAFVTSALSSAGYISTPIDSYDVSNAAYSDSSKDYSGWVKFKATLPLVIQFGYNTAVRGTQVTLPIAFPQAVFTAIYMQDTADNHEQGINNVNTTGFYCNPDGSGVGIHWFAIGY